MKPGSCWRAENRWQGHELNNAGMLRIIPRVGCARLAFRPSLAFRANHAVGPKLHRSVRCFGKEPVAGAGDGAGAGARAGVQFRKTASMIGKGVLVGTVLTGVVVATTHFTKVNKKDHRDDNREVQPDGTVIVRTKYYDGTRRQEYREDSQGRRHGPYTEWYPEGPLRVQCTYVHGNLHGELTTLYPNGKPESKIDYVNGKLEGHMKEWHPNGTPSEETTFKDGLREGASTRWDSQSTMMSHGHYRAGKREGLHTECHPNGKVASAFNYTDGQLDGEYRTMGEDGVVLTHGTCKGGVELGIQRRWHPNGKKKQESYYGTKGLEGSSTEWYDDGVSVRRQIPYRDGAPEGEAVGWHRDGKKEYVAPYQNGQLEGRVVVWSPEGTVTKEAHYKEGRVTKVVTCLDDQGRETVLPDGEIHVWKLCEAKDETYVYVKIRVPKEAKRVTPFAFTLADGAQTSYKARVEYGTVVGIFPPRYEEATSCIHSERVIYRVGQEVRPSSLNEDPNVECGAGINVHLQRDHCDQWIHDPKYDLYSLP